MFVTKLERVTEKKCRVYLNDEPAFILYFNEISRYHIMEDQEFTEALREKLYEEVLSRRAKLRCMNLLKTADKTEYQLRQKLSSDEYPPEIIDQAVEYVKDFHYVDDLRYAVNFIESRKETRTRQQMRCELQSRGVNGELIDRAFEETEPADETAQILRWAQKKHFDPENADRKEQQKFIQFLQRKGFSYSDIKKALT